MAIFTRRIRCATCDSTDTRIIVSTAIGQFKRRLFSGRAYYCCHCGRRGHVGGGFRVLKMMSISLLSGVLLLSLYGNFVGFKPPMPTQEITQEVTIDPTLDPIWLAPENMLLSEINLQSIISLEPEKAPKVLNKPAPIITPLRGIAPLNLHIPLRWQAARKSQRLLIATSFANSPLSGNYTKAKRNKHLEANREQSK